MYVLYCVFSKEKYAMVRVQNYICLKTSLPSVDIIYRFTLRNDSTIFVTIGILKNT